MTHARCAVLTMNAITITMTIKTTIQTMKPPTKKIHEI
jgi:hypothetical protein